MGVCYRNEGDLFENISHYSRQSFTSVERKQFWLNFPLGIVRKYNCYFQGIDFFFFFLTTQDSCEGKQTSFCCRKGDPFQGPRMDSCLTFGNKLSKQIQKQKTFWEGALVDSSSMRELRRTALPCGSQCHLLWEWSCLYIYMYIYTHVYIHIYIHYLNTFQNNCIQNIFK